MSRAVRCGMVRSLLLTILLALPLSAQAQTTPSAAQAQALIDRLLRTSLGSQTRIQITYGAVDPALPLRLGPPFMVLANLRLSSNAGAFVQHRIFATTPLAPNEAQAALVSRLASSGWVVQPGNAPPFGFSSVSIPGGTTFYREGSTNFGLSVILTERAGQTELDLNLNVLPAQLIANFKAQPAQVARSSLPLLQAFPGARIQGAVPAAFDFGAWSTAQVLTTRKAGDVLDFYSAQLQAAGWQQQSETTDGPLRVLTYRVKDVKGQPALGTLGIRSLEQGGGYVLTVSVQGFNPR